MRFTAKHITNSGEIESAKERKSETEEYLKDSVDIPEPACIDLNMVIDTSNINLVVESYDDILDEKVMTLKTEGGEMYHVDLDKTKFEQLADLVEQREKSGFKNFSKKSNSSL